MLVTIHVIIVIATGLLVLYADEQAVAWMLGKKYLLHENRIRSLHHAIASGLALLILTGGFLYAKAAPAYLTDPVFLVKMIAVAALILNTYAINRLNHIALAMPFERLSPRQRLPLFVSGAVSLAGWSAAIICGLLLA